MCTGCANNEATRGVCARLLPRHQGVFHDVVQPALGLAIDEAGSGEVADLAGDLSAVIAGIKALRQPRPSR